jgi:hypothetical protein
MNPPQFDEAQLVPLISDIDIESRVTELIGRANIRQLWLMFLDEGNVQLPLLIPIDGLPSRPAVESAESIVASLRDLMSNIAATSIVMVWERYGSASLTAHDAAWALALHEECRARAVPLRSVLLSHRGGVRLVAPNEYGAEVELSEQPA